MKNFGITARTLQDSYLPLLELPSDLVEVVSSTKFSVILELAKVADVDERRKLTFSAVSKSLGVRQVKAEIKALKGDLNPKLTSSKEKTLLEALNKTVKANVAARNEDTQDEVLTLLEQLTELLN